MDVTAAFTAAARRAASAKGLDADKLCTLRPLPPPAFRAPVLKAAHDATGLIRELRSFVSRHRSEYLREVGRCKL